MVKRDGYSINLHPSPKMISSAFMALIESFGWDSFTILYQVQSLAFDNWPKIVFI